MSDRLNAAIEELQSQLEDQLREVAETKKTINLLCKRAGREPLHMDVAVEQVGSLRPDQFYGKPLSTAAQEYLERRKQASSAEDIMRGLEQGGFDFRALDWKEKDRFRLFVTSLAKNTKTFHRLPNGTFGLLSWYDQAMLKRAEKQSKNGTEEGADPAVAEVEVPEPKV